MSEDYKDFERCKKCGGKCCELYGEHGHELRGMNLWFEEWFELFFQGRENYGVEPLFDPLYVFMMGKEDELEKLRQKGINPDFCQYHSENGCIIDYPKRPFGCRVYNCEGFL